jgi:ankyrin repeat protein
MLEAIAKGDQATLIQLLALNESVNFTQGGTTPLHLAAEKGYPDIMRMLIRHGADYRIKNAQGKTALEVALSKKKFIDTTEGLQFENIPYVPVASNSENRRVDDALWRNQYH